MSQTRHLVREVDPEIRTWRQLNPMPTPLHGIGAATFGSGIYITGGGPVEGSAIASDELLVFVPPAD